MSQVRRLGLAVALIGVLAAAVAGCGSSSGGNSVIIRGTTDQPVSYDPAGAYDLPSYDVIYAIYQNLMTIPAGQSTPIPEAAQKCEYTDNNNQTYECTLKPDLKFSDGTPLTSKDVVFSFERNVKIADPNGGSSLLANMKSVEANGPDKVIFHLKAPDATWPFILTTGSAAIVPDSYPANKLQNSNNVIGSGRYALQSYDPGTQTVLTKSDSYTGSDPAKNDKVIIQYYKTSSDLALALKNGEVNIAYRSLSPTDLNSLKNQSGIQIVSGNGIEIRYLVFNENLQPGATAAQKLAIRQAVAYTVDRQAIASKVYDGTVEPLYSMVPQGLKYATKPFETTYGSSPDVAKAKQVLQQAGVKTPVPMEIWYTPSHYGPVSADEYAEIKSQLDDSGLFDVTLKSTEWNQYSTAAFTDKYPVYQLGWFPDYPDADDYTASFYSKDSFLNDHYSNPEMEKLLAQEKATTNESQRAKAFSQIQDLGAKDAPTIPIWQGKQVAAAQDDIHGIELTFDPSFIFRYWLITKG
jgi:peptide/nickel transport system substrate-binding protein